MTTGWSGSLPVVVDLRGCMECLFESSCSVEGCGSPETVDFSDVWWYGYEAFLAEFLLDECLGEEWFKFFGVKGFLGDGV